MLSLATAAGALILVCLIIATAVVAALSRHQKAATGEIALINSVATVETTLRPEGSVIVRGELWRAISRTGAVFGRGQCVRIVGTSGHLLEVEPA